jgi:hypothetical protein
VQDRPRNTRDNNDERLAKLVLLRLDPILRVLLTLVQQYQSHIKQQQQQQELILNNLKSQSAILDRLRLTITELSTSSFLSAVALGRSLLMTWDYLSVYCCRLDRGN